MSFLLSDRIILVDILSAVFGISSWIAVNGIWTQTPLLVQQLPESFNLLSYIVVLIQVANVGPIIYSFFKSKFSTKRVEVPSIHIILLIGSLACLLSVFFWDHLAVINGTKHSVAFLALTTLLAIMDTTTSLLYFPYMSHFKSKYLVSLIFGEGLSGVVPSAVALIQGVGGEPTCKNISTGNDTYKMIPVSADPRFSVNMFYLCLFILVLLCWLAFILLHHLNICKKERLDNYPETETNQNTTIASNQQIIDSSIEKSSDSHEIISRNMFIYLLLVQAYINAVSNGVLTSIESYAKAPYGYQPYHLAVQLSSIANPISCCIVFLLSTRMQKLVMPVCVSIGTACAIFILIAARMSPTPPGYNTTVGKVFIVIVSIATTASFSFSKTCIAAIFRATKTSHKLLYYCGISTQLGSFIGAVIMFCIVNYANVFHSAPPC
ncbi:riboflavin transporter 2-like [Oppia nitens]|uniref:riboflavin transporter 2-like n=1 Tax=Oppia nitens TaxID=1686743 RepID=UPI0023DC55B2|nr:riboflavin transporter 2-like [Oppia nitens]